MAPEPPKPSLVYSQPSLPPSIQGHDSVPSSFSHPLYFLFSSQPLVPTDNWKKMKAGKGALCLSLSLPAYFSGFILVWPCLSLSYYSCLRLPKGHAYPVPTRCKYYINAHAFTRLHGMPICIVGRTHTFPTCIFCLLLSLTLFWENIFRVTSIILFVQHEAPHSQKG